MSWVEKDTPEPFDQQPIEGLFYLDGNIVVRRYPHLLLDGYKLPMLAFPSGYACELWEMDDKYLRGIVHIFDEFDLPLFDSRDSAFRYAKRIARECDYVVQKVGENGLEVWGRDSREHYEITYSAEQNRMINVEWQPLIPTTG